MPSPYAGLPKGCVRLLRLLPSSDNDSPIKCRLITCPVLDSKRTHSYDALSYAWGSVANTKTIWIDGHGFSVGANLFTALLHLRDGLVERLLWIDAICINQDDKTGEKEQQVQSMARIYSKARRVIVWLGEAAGNSDQAIETIRAAAAAQEEQAEAPLVDETSGQAVVALLEREWFQRIWVLQEVAAARHILIICGRAEVDGYVFCSGLSVLRPFDMRPDLQALIPPVAYLIRGAIFRREQRGDEVSQSARFSLNIHPLGQLVDMYHTRKASIRHDKIFALSGMSSDDPGAAELKVNYNMSWKDLFRDLIYFSLSKQATVSAWEDEEVAVIEAKGCVLGEVSSVRRDDKQHVDIDWKNAPSYFDRDKNGNLSSHFALHVSAKAVEKGDVVCLLQGASRPTIVRLRNGYSSIVMVSMPATENLQKWSASVKIFPADVLLIWDWAESREEPQAGEDYKKLLLSSRDIPRCSTAGCQCLDDIVQVGRLVHFALFLDHIGRFEEALQTLRNAVMVYRTRKGPSMDEAYPYHGSWTGVDQVAIRLIDSLSIHDEGADTEAMDSKRPTLLYWAVRNGHAETVVPLLIEKGASIEASDIAGESWTPFWWATDGGLMETVRLLIERGADIEMRDGRNRGGTALVRASARGHEAMVRLLIDNGGEVNARDQDYRTPLSWAARAGHEAIVRLLIDNGAWIDPREELQRTPLLWAAQRGHEAIARLLIDNGAQIDARDDWWGRTPLLWAADGGHEAVVRLLLDKGARIDAWDYSRRRTPLHLAAGGGHEAVVRLLLDNGAPIDEPDKFRRTPLYLAVSKGYEAVVQLLKSRITPL